MCTSSIETCRRRFWFGILGWGVLDEALNGKSQIEPLSRQKYSYEFSQIKDYHKKSLIKSINHMERQLNCQKWQMYVLIFTYLLFRGLPIQERVFFKNLNVIKLRKVLCMFFRENVKLWFNRRKLVLVI